MQYYPEQVIFEPPVVTAADGGDRQLTVTGLKPFTNYGCSLTANTSVGEGPPTDTMTQATVESGEYYVYHLHEACTLPT